MNKLTSIGGVVAVVLLLGGGLWYLLSYKSVTDLSALAASGVSSQQTGIGKVSGRSIPPDDAEYYNPYYHFSILYPNSLTVHEHPEQGGAITVTFEYDDKKTVQGFQIFIVPFAGGQITDARFKEDDPSGVRKNLTNVTIAGATGASFYSTDSTLGDTAEVWFIKNGYLYEATTFKELDTWLAGIVSSWMFY